MKLESCHGNIWHMINCSIILFSLIIGLQYVQRAR